MKNCNSKFKINKGFSLLETLVAISILMITIVGPLTLASKGIVFADYVKDEITGFYLAQEAVEAIRNIRDTNIKNHKPWLNNIKNFCMDGKICRIDIWNFSDTTTNGLESCKGGCNADQDVRKDFELMKVVDVGDAQGTARLYGYFETGPLSAANKEASKFSRRITITPIDYSTALDSSGRTLTPRQLLAMKIDASGVDEVNVTVEVSWYRAALQRGNDPTKTPDQQINYAERKIRVSENMFSI